MPAKIALYLIVLGGSGLITFREADDNGPGRAEAQRILQDFVTDFRADPFAATPVTFGVRIKGPGASEWTIRCAGRKTSQAPSDVTLREGFPDGGTVYFEMSLDTLRKIHRGEMAEITAAGKARSSEIAPVEVDGIAPRIAQNAA